MLRFSTTLRTALIVALAMLASGSGFAPLARADDGDAQIGPDGALCRFQTDRQGRLGGLPPNLLTAISFVETGRWDSTRGETTAWPWTVTSEGKGRFFPSKEAAIAEVKRLQRRGIRNIDVGCMQINLYYHGEAFPTLDEAFDPANNVAYAVAFLQSLYEDLGSWPDAATRYHSATPEYANRYKIKITDAWKALNAKTGVNGGSGSQTLASLPQSLQKYQDKSKTSKGLLDPAQRATLMEHRRNVAISQAEAEFSRAQAKAFAESWRAEKLAKYMEEKKKRSLSLSQ